jgi:hypothetical protein
VSVRTWRRWERGEVTPSPVVARWLRLQSGHLPGWPPHLRWRRDGIWVDDRTADGFLVRQPLIEGVPWLLDVIRRDYPAHLPRDASVAAVDYRAPATPAAQSPMPRR